jgi:allantoin racemase
MLVINPNTNSTITSLIKKVAKELAVEGIVTSVVNPDSGPISIESNSDRRMVEPQVIEIIKRAEDSGYNGIVIACFDDIGMEKARQFVAIPLVDAFSASLSMVSHLTSRFSIVTTYSGAVSRITALANRYFPSAQYTVRASGIGVAEAASSDSAYEKLCQTIQNAIEKDGAEAIVLGSGGLTGKAEKLSVQFGIPIVDAVGAAVSMCQAMVRLNFFPMKHCKHLTRG